MMVMLFVTERLLRYTDPRSHKVTVSWKRNPGKIQKCLHSADVLDDVSTEGLDVQEVSISLGTTGKVCNHISDRETGPVVAQLQTA